MQLLKRQALLRCIILANYPHKCSQYLSYGYVFDLSVLIYQTFHEGFFSWEIYIGLRNWKLMHCSVLLYIVNLSCGKCAFFLVCVFLVRMKLKEIKRTAIQSWSPSQQHPIYLATGRRTRPRHELITKLVQTRPIWLRLK